MLEILASAAALGGIYLTTRKMSIGWMLGTLGSVLYAMLFFRNKLYAESVLQLVYAILGIRGWLLWKNDDAAAAAPVKNINFRSLLLGLFGITLLTMVIGWMLSNYSDSDMPWLDAMLAASGLLVTVWMMQRYLENWLFWIGIDIVSAVLYFSRSMPVAALVYLIFTAMAIYGYVHWKKAIACD